MINEETLAELEEKIYEVIMLNEIMLHAFEYAQGGRIFSNCFHNQSKLMQAKLKEITAVF